MHNTSGGQMWPAGHRLTPLLRGLNMYKSLVAMLAYREL